MKCKRNSVLFILILAISACGCTDTQTTTEKNVKESEIPNGFILMPKPMSPNGMYSVFTIMENENDYQIKVSNNVENKEVSSVNIIGNDIQYLWSPDSKLVAVSYSGRIWKDYLIINLETGEEIDTPSPEETIKHLKADGESIDYKLNENRPDSYVQPLEWSPDSSQLLVSYVWNDNDYAWQNGVMTYNPIKNQYERIIQYEPCEGETFQPSKPEKFSW